MDTTNIPKDTVPTNLTTNVPLPWRPSITSGSLKVSCPDNMPPVVPKRYLDLGIECGYNPPPLDSIRLYLTGPSGDGKTTFISTDSDTVILDFEDGAWGVPGSRTQRWVIKTWQQYQDILALLIADGNTGKRVFNRVSIDTTDKWAAFMAARVVWEYNQTQPVKLADCIVDVGTMGRPWFLVRDRCMADLMLLRNAGYGWTVVGHEASRLIDDPDNPGKKKRSVEETLFPTMHQALVQDCDIRAKVYSVPATKTEMVTVTIGGKSVAKPHRVAAREYRLSVRSTPDTELKVRGVPDLMGTFVLGENDGWQVLKVAYDEAVSKAKERMKQVKE